MKSSLTRTRWAAIGAAVAVTLGGGAVFVANAATSPSSVFTAITPCRLLDTRTDGSTASKVVNLGIRKEALGDKSRGNRAENDITVIFDERAKRVEEKFTLRYTSSPLNLRPIMGACDAQFATGGDLEDANYLTTTAVLLNVTTVNMSASGFVTVYPWQKLCVEADGHLPTKTCTPATGTDIKNRPLFSSLNPIGNFSSVSNNATVLLQPITESTVIPDVACASGDSWGASNCRYSTTVSPGTNDQLNAFRVYNENGSTQVIIDVLGYYSSPS